MTIHESLIEPVLAIGVCLALLMLLRVFTAGRQQAAGLTLLRKSIFHSTSILAGTVLVDVVSYSLRAAGFAMVAILFVSYLRRSSFQDRIQANGVQVQADAAPAVRTYQSFIRQAPAHVHVHCDTGVSLKFGHHGSIAADCVRLRSRRLVVMEQLIPMSIEIFQKPCFLTPSHQCTITPMPSFLR